MPVYRFQKDGRIDEAIQEWRNIANYVEGADNDLAARAWISAGYLYAYRELGERGLFTNDQAMRLQLGSPEVYINPEAFENIFFSYSEAIRLKPDYAEAYYKRMCLFLIRKLSMCGGEDSIELNVNDRIVKQNRG